MVAAAGDLFVAPVPPASPFEGRVQHGRGRDSPEAVHRRRMFRKLRSAAKAGRSQQRAESTAHNAEVANRLARRFYPNQATVDVLLLDIRYWQARRCGWDVRSNQIRTVGRDPRTGRPVLCDPTDTVIWQWWIDLHYGERATLVALSEFRLLSDMKSTGLRSQKSERSTVTNNPVTTSP